MPASTVYDLDSPSLSVQVFLKQPTNVARALTALTWQRYVADKIFLMGSPESGQGGTARYERAVYATTQTIMSFDKTIETVKAEINESGVTH